MRKLFKILKFEILMVIFLMLLGQGAFAFELELLGIGWNKEVVTVLIKPAKGVTPQAVEDVKTAIGEWNSLLLSLKNQGEYVPILDLIEGEKSADIIIHMKVGGGSVLGYTLPKTISPFSCVLKSIRIQLSGKAFGQNFSSAGTRNVARHELGHALGLGHSDDPTDLMYATADSSEIFGDTEVFISDCDKKGIKAIYPLPEYCTIPDSIECE